MNGYIIFTSQNNDNQQISLKKPLQIQLLDKHLLQSSLFVCKEMKDVTQVAQIMRPAVAGAAWFRVVAIYSYAHVLC